MKILFMDADGVLNRHERLPGSAYCGVEPECVAQLNRVLAATGASIVVSSAWRYMILSGTMTVVGFEHLLRTHGLVGRPGVVLATTGPDDEYFSLPTPDERARQVAAWLADHGPVEAYAVVDDDDFGWEAHGHPCVLTDPHAGLTGADADRLIGLLARVPAGVAP